MPKSWVKSFAIVSVLLLAGFAAMNLLDEPMDAEVFHLLQRPEEKPTGPALEAFQYAIGLGAPPDQDPLKYGQEIYQQAYADNPNTAELLQKQKWIDTLDELVPPAMERAARYLTAPEFNPLKTRLEEVSTQGELLRERYDHLIHYGMIAPDIRGAVPLRSITVPLIALWRLKAIELNLELKRDHDAAVLRDLEAIFAFHRASVLIAPTMIKVSANLYTLKEVRAFVEKAAANRPAFAKLLQTDKAAFHVDLDLEKLEAQALQNELRGTEVLLLDEKVAAQNQIRPLVYRLASQQRNRILNHDFDCLGRKSARVSWTLRPYPIVHGAVSGFCRLAEQFRARTVGVASLLMRPL